MSYYVYILFFPVEKIFYVGQTRNLQDRIRRHDNGWSVFTSSRKEARLIWACTKETRSEAVLLERKLKNINQLRKIQFIRKYKEGMASPIAESWLEEFHRQISSNSSSPVPDEPG